MRASDIYPSGQTFPFRHLIRGLFLRRFRLGTLVLGCLLLSPNAPAADGGLPNQNTAEGQGALSSLTTGHDNTAIGFNALSSTTTGFFNTASGSNALTSNTDGFGNTGNGDRALRLNTSGFGNTAIGAQALENNTGGFANTALGSVALGSNTTGGNNSAIGNAALRGNTTGNYNVAVGLEALGINTTGSHNTAVGFDTLVFNTTGSNNIALGNEAGFNLTTGDFNIDIGNKGKESDANTIRIGSARRQTATFVSGISGVPVSGNQVVVNANGKLGVIASSARFKQDIKRMDKASEAIFALRPVSFRYNEEIDPDGNPQFGLIAEEVEKVDPDLVGRDENGRANTVRYEAVNTMLLNEFLKQQRKVQEQETTIARQQKQIEALTAGLQKLIDRSELDKASPQLETGEQ